MSFMEGRRKEAAVNVTPELKIAAGHSKEKAGSS